MADHKKNGHFKVTIPPGCKVKEGTKITAGQSGGPIPQGGTIIIESNIENESKEGDLVFEYFYEWPHSGDDNPDSVDSPE